MRVCFEMIDHYSNHKSENEDINFVKNLKMFTSEIILSKIQQDLEILKMDDQIILSKAFYRLFSQNLDSILTVTQLIEPILELCFEIICPANILSLL